MVHVVQKVSQRRSGFLGNKPGMVTPTKAMRMAAVYGCIKILADTMGALRMQIMVQDGDHPVATKDHPLYHVLCVKPNCYQSASHYRTWQQGAISLRGNAYALKEFRGSRLAGLWPIHPDLVYPRWVGGYREHSYRHVYDIQGYHGVKTYRSSEVVHYRGDYFFGEGANGEQAGLIGLSPIEVCMNAFALGMDMEEFGGRFFREGTHLSGVLETKNVLDDQEFEHLRKGFKKRSGNFSSRYFRGPP